jgi:hypothetical protein
VMSASAIPGPVCSSPASAPSGTKGRTAIDSTAGAEGSAGAG